MGEKFMRRALALAERGRGLVTPNPLVGAVLVRDGKVVGEGWHEGPGRPHAEAMALADAGDEAAGATLYCTLEPCDHHGRMPPCTEALIRAGVVGVVAATGDPNPVVDGRGLARLAAAGIGAEAGLLASEAERQNRAYLKQVSSGLPLVTLKLAATLDGKLAARDGSSQWITGEPARADAHRLRASADAIAIGAGAALADDPSLTVRDPSYRGPPVLRIFLDASGRVPPRGRLFDGSAPTLVATTEGAPRANREAWRDAGAEVVVLEAGEGGVSLAAFVAMLGKRDVQHLLVEGGSQLSWSMLESDLIDRFVLYLAPLLVGGTTAPGVIGGEGFAPIAAARSLEIVEVARVGSDLRVEADVHRHR